MVSLWRKYGYDSFKEWWRAADAREVRYDDLQAAERRREQEAIRLSCGEPTPPYHLAILQEYWFDGRMGGDEFCDFLTAYLEQHPEVGHAG